MFIFKTSYIIPFFLLHLSGIQSLDSGSIENKITSTFYENSPNFINVRPLIFLQRPRRELIRRLIVSVEDEDSVDDSSLSSESSSDEVDDLNEEIPTFVCNKGAPCNCTFGESSAMLDCTGEPLNTAFIDAKPPERIINETRIFNPHVIKMVRTGIKSLATGKVLPYFGESVNELDFSKNQITFIERNAFERFSNLTKLKLSHNLLRGDDIMRSWLTEELGYTLHQLYLDYNRIQKIRYPMFDNLKNLTKLMLDGNRGIQLKKEVFSASLSKLKILSLEHCDLKAIPEDLFDNLKNLVALSLSGNPLTSVPLGALAKPPLKSLSIFWMSETQIAPELPSNAFSKVPWLKRIYLRRMPSLRTLANCSFCGVPGLELIDLTGSRHLSVVHPNIFGYAPGEQNGQNSSTTSDHSAQSLPHLKYLRFQDCNLTELSKDILTGEGFSNLEQLELTGNPFNCSCRLAWIVKTANKTFSDLIAGQNLTCSNPQQFCGKPLQSMVNLDCEPKQLIPQNDRKSWSASIFIVFLTLSFMGTFLFSVDLYVRRRHRYAGSDANYFSSANTVPPFSAAFSSIRAHIRMRRIWRSLGFQGYRNLIPDDQQRDPFSTDEANDGDEVHSGSIAINGLNDEFHNSTVRRGRLVMAGSATEGALEIGFQDDFNYNERNEQKETRV